MPRTFHRPTVTAPPGRTGQPYQGGIVPTGYTVGDDSHLVANPDQQDAIARAVELRNQGKPLAAISAKTGLSQPVLSRMFRRHRVA